MAGENQMKDVLLVDAGQHAELTEQTTDKGTPASELDGLGSH
jgi:hypothetical protein